MRNGPILTKSTTYFGLIWSSKKYQTCRIEIWLKTHVSLQEAVLGLNGGVVLHEEEIFLLLLILTSHAKTIHLERHNFFYLNAT